ncbi:MAG TPA: iron-containing alcohol dehydrogenase [Symbiobacteriaceae bacterium]
MNFVFRTTSPILFGYGESARAGEIAAHYGHRVFLVTGAASLERSGQLERIIGGLTQAGVEWVHWRVSGEPTTHVVDEGADLCRSEGCDVVLAVGGGSVMDAGKAVAALVTNGGKALEYLEAVEGGGRRTIQTPPLPLICVPTTAGTGSEVTRNAVLTVPEARVKRSMRSDLLQPRVAIVDPHLASLAPLSVSTAAAFDALTQLIESYLSKGAQPMTDALAVPGIRLALRSLRAMAEGSPSRDHWEGMALASLWSGITLSNAGLGVVHGLVAPLGGLRPIPHGAACACLLPHAIRVNARALLKQRPGHNALARLIEVAGMIVTTGEPTPDRAATELERLRRQLGGRMLRDYGFTREDFPAIIAGAKGSSMRYNPIDLSEAELEEILAGAL